MTFEALPAIIVQVIMSLLHAGVTVAGFAILRAIRSWPIVFVLALGLSALSLALTAGGFLMQGWEQASKFLLPSGELFAFHTLPIAIGSILTNVLVMSAAYAFFVEPGNRKHV
jgi:hypothetical protein